MKDAAADIPAEPVPAEILATTLSGAGFGMIACLGLGLGRSDGFEPWLAAPLALALAGGATAVATKRFGGAKRAMPALSRWRDSWVARETAFSTAALALFLLHLLLWLPFGLRLWQLGLLAAAAAIATVFATSMIYAQRRDAPRWSRAPTPILFLALGAAGGLLGLSAIENLLGYPPSLVVWKAAMALIGAALAGQLWGAQADEASSEGAPPLLDDPVFARGRARAKTLRMAAIALGLAIPMGLTIAADFIVFPLFMPLAFVSHLAGVAAHRWLFFAEADRTEPA